VSWPEGVQETGRYRTINRQKLDRAALEAELAQPASLRRLVYDGHIRLLRARGRSPAFQPHGDQTVLALDPAVFALVRASADGRAVALCLHNVGRRPRVVSLDLPALGLPAGRDLIDLLDGTRFRPAAGALTVRLDAYDVCWLIEAGD
jgi:sucrose phosphorylase